MTDAERFPWNEPEDALMATAPSLNLGPVIEWLEGGCDPLEAAKELRIYQARAAVRQPLTDSRIWELALATSSTQGGWESGWNVAFARAIEAAHGIGGKP